MADIASQTVGDVMKIVMGYIMKHVGYVTSSTKHVRRMENRMKHLEGTSIDVKEHMDENNRNNKNIPARVPGWLDDVTDIKEVVESISTKGHLGCFNIKGRHQAAVNALEATNTIESLIKENSEIIWRDAQRYLGRVHSEVGSTSTPLGGDTQTGSKSRDRTFNVALKHLQQDEKTRVIALCGMGGIGKTTMMKQLKRVARDNKMFKWIVTVVVGRNPDMKSIQHVVAVQTGGPLSETHEKLKAEYLRERFEKLSKIKEKSLVILDDVWNKIELEDIGLSPLPNGVKLLLTSRDVGICRQIASDVEIVQVEVLEETEARALFFQITEVSEHQDPDLTEIGGEIVKKCGGLPLAIKLIAPTLKSKRKPVWKDMLHRMKKNNPGEKVQECIEISFTNIKEAEDKAIFRLCGMFPEDSYIPIEDLTRYAWGLKLLEDVSTVGDARDRTETCVQRLIDANLLMNIGDSDHNDCVKMHDLVLAFVVDSVSKGEDAWVVDHGDMSKRNEVKMSKSCKQISLACKGGPEFPHDFKFPNLSFLKLLQGDESLLFPENFYGEMDNLQVISFDEMTYPLLPTSSIQYLRTLCLHKCSLTFDISCIGDLSNLEVLSFANSRVKKLPCTFKNLKKLRLLDLTGCDKFIVIDDGVLKSLVTLEELYMTAAYDYEQNGIEFTDNNYNELSEVSKKLSALDIELFKNEEAQPRKMSFQNLKRFRISVGCFLKKNVAQSYKNTLMLVTSKHELLQSRMNRLFGKTEVLLLAVDGMNNLVDMEIPGYSSFHNLRDLVIKNCGELRYLFTLNVATAMSKLESLAVSSCPIMEELIHIESHEAPATITFPKLKSLNLGDLPMLSCLCNTVNVIQLLPGYSSFHNLRDLVIKNCGELRYLFTLNVATAMSNLESLEVSSCPIMEELIHIESHEAPATITFPKLKSLNLGDLPMLSCLCNTVNVIELLQLADLELRELPNFTCIYPKNKLTLTSSTMRPLLNKEVVIPRLERLSIWGMENLEEIWPACENTTSSSEVSMLRKIKVQVCNRLVNLFPCNPMSLLPHLEELEMWACYSIQVLFNIDMDSGREVVERKSKLRRIKVSSLGQLREIWRVKGVNNSDIIISSFQSVEYISIYLCQSFRNVFAPTTSNFHMRTLLEIANCEGSMVNSELIESTGQEQEVHDNIAFPSSCIHNFHHLHNLELNECYEVEVVFEINSATTHQKPLQVFPYLENLHLRYMTRMSHVWKCNNWNEYPLLPSFHNLTTIGISHCHNIKYLFSPLMAKLLSNLKEVCIKRCDDIEEVVSNRDDDDGEITTIFPHLGDLYLDGLQNLKHVGGGAMGGSKSSQVGVVTWSLCQYARELCIEKCDVLPVVIPSYAVGQMQKLEKLKIWECESLKEVFESQMMTNNNNTTLDLPMVVNIDVPQLSHLREIEIYNCDLLEYLFSFSTLKSLGQLEKLTIKECEAMKEIVKQEISGEQSSSDQVVVFPCLKSVELIDLPNLLGFFLGKNKNVFEWKSLEKVEIRECPQVKVFTSGHSTAPNLNFIHTSLGKYHIPDQCGLNYFHQIPQGSPWSYQNLVEMNLEDGHDGKNIIPFSELLQVKKLERILVNRCSKAEEIFEVPLEETNNTNVEIPNLREIELFSVDNLKYIWKGMMVLKFPNLTTVRISYCDSLKHVFTSSMVGSLLQLQHLQIDRNKNIEVIVKDEEGEQESDCIVKQIELPRLKSLTLEWLSSLKGFCLGKKKAFSFPSLDTLNIEECPELKVFTTGHSTTPELKRIKMTFGMCDLREDLNSFIHTKLQEGLKL